MMVSGGCPENYEKNKEITIGELDESPWFFMREPLLKTTK